MDIKQCSACDTVDRPQNDIFSKRKINNRDIRCSAITATNNGGSILK